MSNVRIFFNPLNAKDTEEYSIEPGTQIIDFLQEHYPAGFNGMLRVFVGVEEVQIEDLDRVVGEEEQVTMLVMPSGAAIGALTPYLVNALIAVAIGFAINLLFPPSAPSAFTEESESPVYSLNASRNAARLGDPIPAVYGTCSWPADFASAPYQFFTAASNDMYVDHLFCLGHGQFEIEEVYIGDTPVRSIEPGSVRYWIFDEFEHGQSMGRLSARINTELKGTDNNWPFRENVFTSPEVESWEFSDQPSEEDATVRGISGVAKASYYDPISRQDIFGNISGVDSGLNLRPGDTITISGTAANNGNFLIGSIETDPESP